MAYPKTRQGTIPPIPQSILTYQQVFSVRQVDTFAHSMTILILRTGISAPQRPLLHYDSLSLPAFFRGLVSLFCTRFQYDLVTPEMSSPGMSAVRDTLASFQDLKVGPMDWGIRKDRDVLLGTLQAWRVDSSTSSHNDPSCIAKNLYLPHFDSLTSMSCLFFLRVFLSPLVLFALPLVVLPCFCIPLSATSLIFSISATSPPSSSFPSWQWSSSSFPSSRAL